MQSFNCFGSVIVLKPEQCQGRRLRPERAGLRLHWKVVYLYLVFFVNVFVKFVCVPSKRRSSIFRLELRRRLVILECAFLLRRPLPLFRLLKLLLL